MFKKYYNLTKPKVVALIIFTAAVGMLLAGVETVPLSQSLAAIWVLLWLLHQGLPSTIG